MSEDSEVGRRQHRRELSSCFCVEDIELNREVWWSKFSFLVCATVIVSVAEDKRQRSDDSNPSNRQKVSAGQAVVFVAEKEYVSARTNCE